MPCNADRGNYPIQRYDVLSHNFKFLVDSNLQNDLDFFELKVCVTTKVSSTLKVITEMKTARGAHWELFDRRTQEH